MSCCHNSSFDCSFYYYQYLEFFGKYTECKEKIIEAENFSTPMLWVGIYVAAVSLVCSLAMAADAFQGFRHGKLWFPCKFFTLNATSLTLLAVAMKLPMDLNNPMPGRGDQIAKLSSTAFLCTIMGNFMLSLGTMDDKELRMNITAVGILAITLLVNICIQLYTGLISDFVLEHVVVMASVLVLLVILSFSALTVPACKKILDLKYNEIQKIGSNEDQLEEIEKDIVEKLKEDVKKYWMMAETSSLQFVMMRSATSSASGVICFLTALTLAEAEIRMYLRYEGHLGSISDYKWSTLLILAIQSIGVVVGTIAPTFRWFTAISFKCSKGRRNNYRDEFKIEKYWIQRLVEWKESTLALPIRERKWRKLVHETKYVILNFCIGFQMVIVVASKTIQFISIFLISLILSCWFYCKWLKKTLMFELGASNNHTRSESEPSTELDHSWYVFQLEGEEELPKKILKSTSDAANRLIQMAKKHHPKNLIELLEKSRNFKGVSKFDSDQVSEEPPNCWSLPVVTLTSIAIALPNVRNDTVEWLLCSVSQGILYIKLIEKLLDTKGDMVNIRNAADILWLEVELYHKWLENDLHKMALRGKTSEENLQMLANIAKKRVMEFKRNVNGSLEESLLNWPVKVIAANSMYRISQSLLMDYHGSNDQTDEKLFEQISVTIAEIVSSCLTNLPRVITTKLLRSPIKQREESIRLAACLLGETEEILKIFQQQKFSSSDPDQVAYVDE